jgi:uncharacterized protein YkwD
MRGHRLRYTVVAIGIIIPMMVGCTTTRDSASHAGHESATSGVLGATVEPGRDLFALLPSPTPSTQQIPPAATPTASPASAADAPAPVPAQAVPTQAAPPSAAPPSTAADTPPQPPPPEPPPPPPPTDWPDYGFAASVLALINSERAARGLAPFEVHPALAAAAQAYARLLVTTGSMGHEGPDGSTVASRIYGAGLPGPTYLAETVWWAAGSLGPGNVVSAWLASPSHRQQILSPTFRLAGIGCHFRLADKLHTRCVLDLAAG